MPRKRKSDSKPEEEGDIEMGVMTRKKAKMDTEGGMAVERKLTKEKQKTSVSTKAKKRVVGGDDSNVGQQQQSSSANTPLTTPHHLGSPSSKTATDGKWGWTTTKKARQENGHADYPDVDEETEPKGAKTEHGRCRKAKSVLVESDGGIPVNKKSAEEGSGRKNANWKKTGKQMTVVRDPSSTSSSESEWEDVADHPNSVLDPTTSDAAETSKSIQITMNAPKTKKELDFEGELRRAIKRFRKELQENLHKAHLLTYFAYGRHLSAACNNDMNQAIALSMIPVGYTSFGKEQKAGKDQLKRFVKWFCSSFTLMDAATTGAELIPDDLILDIRNYLQTRVASSQKMLALCFVTTMRALGFDTRIIINAHPVSRKVESEGSSLGSISKKPGNGSRKSTEKVVPTKKQNASQPSTSGLKRTARQEGRAQKEGTKTPRKKKIVSPLDSEWDPEEDIQKGDNTKKLTKRSSAGSSNRNSSSSTSSNRSLSDLPVKGEATCEYWAEVYMEGVEQWYCVNCIDGSVDNVDSIRGILTSPVLYCLAIDKDLALKDVTSRYASDFMSTQTRRLRAPGDWLSETLALFRSTKRIRNRLEDMQLEAKLSDQSLPSSINEYKNHPLYVLKRDLKKFEAIYPGDIEPIGYVRNEPVYPRSTVHTLHSADTWRKEALSVRQNEEPYKIVKGRPKWDSVTKQVIGDREVPVYGRWQTEPYRAPAPKNGIVPRNEYGNVYLFKKTMLPPGTVHLQLPGLLSIAKKMDVDCAPAMTGWDFHGRASHPVLDGWVVCEEYKDALVAAWEEEQEHAEERERERRSNKAVQNWRRLVKSLLVREKLRTKFRSHMGDTNAAYAQKAPDAGMETEKDINKKVGGKSEEVGETSKKQLAAGNATAWPQRHHEFTGQDEEL